MKSDKSKSTILVISMGCLVTYLLTSWYWTVIASLIIGIVGIISGSLSRLIERWWMKLARVLSYIIPSILLGVVFYLVLFPISLISKLFTRDPLMLSNKYKTHFVDINREFDMKSFEKTW